MTAPPTIGPGMKVGHWLVIAVDGRRATVRCRCKEIREVAIAALEDGTSSSCGCSTPSPSDNRAVREAVQERQRRRFFDWRPERGR